MERRDEGGVYIELVEGITDRVESWFCNAIGRRTAQGSTSHCSSEQIAEGAKNNTWTRGKQKPSQRELGLAEMGGGVIARSAFDVVGRSPSLVRRGCHCGSRKKRRCAATGSRRRRRRAAGEPLYSHEVAALRNARICKTNGIFFLSRLLKVFGFRNNDRTSPTGQQRGGAAAGGANRNRRTSAWRAMSNVRDRCNTA